MKRKKEMMEMYNMMAQVINSIPKGILVLKNQVDKLTEETDYEILLINPVILKDLKSFREEEVIGKYIKKDFPEMGNGEFIKCLDNFIDQSLFIQEKEINFKSKYINGWHLVRLVKIDDGISVSYTNINKSKIIEELVIKDECEFR